MTAAYDPPRRRFLRAYALDPLRSELDQSQVTLDIPYEALDPGPSGALVKVIDYDPTRDCWYQPVDLDDPNVVGQAGMAPSESDPRFHQQMVYAVASSVLEAWEISVGRRFSFVNDGPIEMYPHAFEDQNVWFAPGAGAAPRADAILFGYFRADRRHPGETLPNQVVYTCLSHDIVAHELTHAIVHRARPWLDDPTNHDVAAFHEGFADIIAILHHFTVPGLVRRELERLRGTFEIGNRLLELARQFGEGAGMGTALRTAFDEPDPGRLARTLEPHDRGAILVGAVLGAFIDCYRRRSEDLIRIATGGTGLLGDGCLPSDLVTRLAQEAVDTARRIFTICVRAFDYLPVVDVTFGDFLRALVTVDSALFPTDQALVRATLIDSFRQRGIFAEDVGTLGQAGLCWPPAPARLPVLDGVDRDGAWSVGSLVAWAAEGAAWDPRARLTAAERSAGQARAARMATALQRLFSEHAARFGLHRDTRAHPVAVRGFHASFRPAEDLQSRVDIVIQVGQRRRDIEQLPALEGTGLQIRAGTTVVCGADGVIRHVIPKPLPASAAHPFRGPGAARYRSILQFVGESDAMDGTMAWRVRPRRVKERLSFRALHQTRGGGAG